MFNSMGSSNPQDLGNGGTLDGDVVITGDLSVSGGISLTLSEVIEGTSTIDITNTEAFLVRKNGDGGDVFVVDTTNSRIGIGGTPDKALTISSVNAQLHIKESDAGTNLKNWLFNAEGGVLYYQTLTDAIGGGSTYMQVNRTEATTTSVSFPTGNVGIGLVPVANRLHIHEGDSTQSFIHITNTTTGTTHDDGLLVGIDASEQANIWNRENTSTLFATNNTQRMEITGSGAVNITGTLDVSGDVTLSGTNTLLVSNGSAGSPRYAFTNSATTGLFLPSSNALGIATNGVERINISDAGLVGIGGSASAKLHIKQDNSTTDTTNGLLIENDGTGDAVAQFLLTGTKRVMMGIDNSDSDKFKIVQGVSDLGTADGTVIAIDGSKNIAIGHSNPDTTLHISGSGAKEIRMQSSDSASRLRLEGATQSDIILKDTAGGSNTKTMQQVIMDDVFKFRTLTDAGGLGIDPVLQIDLATGKLGVGVSPTHAKMEIIGDADAFQLTFSDVADSDNATKEARIGMLHYKQAEEPVTLMYAQSGSSTNTIYIGGGTGVGNHATSIGFATASTYNSTSTTTNMLIDNNSRISLSNNDSGTQNTVFGSLAGTNIDAGSNYNVFIGHNVAGNGTLNDATENTGVGYGALAELTSGDGNTALGRSALLNITSGTYNSVVGFQAADALNTGQENVVIGRNAMGVATSQSSCTLIGVNAGANINNNDANGTVALGINCLTSLTEGRYNTSVGTNSSENLTTGDYNTSIGYFAMKEIVDGSKNTAVGYGAMQNSVGGTTSDGSSDNTFIGYLSGGGQWANTQSIGNTAVGSETGMSDSWNGPSYSSLFGYQAGKDITTGSRNTLIGYACGDSITTGITNTGLGAEASFDIDANNQIAIGYQASTTSTGANTVVLGNADVTDVYMAQDSGAYVHSQNVPNHVANTMSSPYYRFDGVNDEIAIADSNNLTFGDGSSDSPFSISAWIYMEDATNFKLISKGVYGSTLEYILNVSSDDKLKLEIYNGTDFEVASTSSTLTAYEGQWIHVASTYNGVGGASANAGMTLYINGVSQALTLSDSGTYTAMPNSSSEVRILNYADSIYGRGSVSCLRVWNKELTATEVKDDYSGASVPNKYKGSNQTNLISSAFTNLSSTYESFSGASASGFTASNSSGNAYAESADEISLEEGKSYVINFNAAITSGTYPTVSVLYFSGGNHATLGNVEYQVVAGANSFVFTSIVTTNTLIRFTNAGTTNDTLVISGLTVTRAGAVAEYDGSSAGEKIWGDKSGNDLHGTVSSTTLENTPYNDRTEYETGTFTPVLSDGSNNATNHSSTKGIYTKTGNCVSYNIWIRITSKGSIGDTAGLRITGLPYVNGDGFHFYSGINVGYGANLSLDNATETITGYVEYANSYITLQNWDDTDSTNPLVGSDILGTAQLMVRGQYWVSD